MGSNLKHSTAGHCLKPLPPPPRLPALHSLHKVTIAETFYDGVGVRLLESGFKVFVHHSQLSDNFKLDESTAAHRRIWRIDDFVQKSMSNEDMWVKIVYAAKPREVEGSLLLVWHLSCCMKASMSEFPSLKDVSPTYQIRNSVTSSCLQYPEDVHRICSNLPENFYNRFA
jgi:hypothetical protein